MCDKSNSLVVVKELLSHLANADISIREEMVLKIAILAERYAPNYKWYIDTILFIIKNSGNVIDDNIWHRACQIVSNQEDLQSYAAQTMFDAVNEKQVNEMLVRAASYILGEYVCFNHFIISLKLQEYQRSNTGTEVRSKATDRPRTYSTKP